MSTPQLDTEVDMSQILNDAQTAQTYSKSNGGGVNYLKLIDGVTRVRILPVPANQQYTKRRVPYYEVTKHFIMGEKGKNTSVVCSSKKHGHCPVCEEWGRLQNVGNKQMAGTIRPQSRYVYTALNDKNEVCILDLDFKPHEALLSVISSYAKRTPGFNPYDIYKGRWFDIEKRKDQQSKGQRFQKNIFTVTVALEPSSIPEAVINKYLDLYIYPEKLYVEYLPEELGMALDGDWSFLKRYAKNEDVDSQPRDEQPQTRRASTQLPPQQSEPVQRYQPPQATRPVSAEPPPYQAVDTMDDEIDSILGDR